MLTVRGKLFGDFRFLELQVVMPVTRDPHVGHDQDAVIIETIGIEEKSGSYVKDLRTGMVKMVRG